MQTAEGGSSQWKHVQVKELEERKMGNNSSGKLGWLALGLWKGWGCLSRLDLKDAAGKRY